jgi:hypothetical protein
MIVPSFDDFIASERVTAAKLNKNVRDSGNFYKAVPFAHAYLTAALSVPTGGTWQTINLDTEQYDNDNMFVTSTPGRLTIQTPGMYYIEGQVRYASDSANQTKARAGRIQINASTDLDTQYVPCAPSNSTQVYLKGYRQLAAGDYLTLGTLHYESVAESVHVGSQHYTYLRAKWVNA